MGTAEPVILVRDVVVSYDGRRVLNGINLEVLRGETMVFSAVVALAKALSCGKSSAWSGPNQGRC